jgi:hypothetical protein
MAACSWNVLPTELKLHTITFIDPESVKVLSEVSCETYALCVPTLFRVCLQLAPPTHAQLTNPPHAEHHSEQL